MQTYRVVVSKEECKAPARSPAKRKQGLEVFSTSVLLAGL